MVALTHFPHAVKQTLPGISGPNVNAWLGDVAVSNFAVSNIAVPNDENSTVGCFFHMDKSDEPRVYECTCHEMNIIVEGEMTISDTEGNVVEANVGDVFYFPKGSVITFNSNSRGVGFFCGQRQEGEASMRAPSFSDVF